jgi:pimeloyl-ACP methyl ester carboxylesterase
MEQTLPGIRQSRRRLPRMLIYILVAFSTFTLGAAWWLYRPDAPRATLEALWAQAPSQFLPIAGLRLHVRDTGPREAPVILALHGFGSSLHAWDFVAAGLLDSHRVIRIDLPGFGLTGADPTRDYSDTRAHAVLLALLDAMHLDRVTMLGSSMGGRIAWSFAAAHPARVERLVLMAPDGFASPSLEYGRTPRVPLLMQALPYTLPDTLLRSGLQPAFANPGALTQPLFERYRDMMLAPGVRRAIIERMGQHVLQPPEPMLARITAPTLLLWGDQDRMVPVSNAQDYLRALSDARLVVLPGIGHVPMEEVPGQVIDALRAFIPGATPPR